ncbi:MAG TPA: PAS domain S-box protein [Arenimonas sp.]|nr:PAS domain S-box protein [Arenimonas sp.]
MKEIEELRNLREQCNFYRTAVENSPTFFVALTTDGKIARINTSLLQALEYAKEELVGQHYQDLIPADLALNAQKLMAEILSTKGTIKFETFLYTKSGKALLIEWHGYFHENEAGEVDYFFGHGRDITERRSTIEKLQESQRRLSTLMSNLPGMAYRCQNDANYTMEFTSEGSLALTGYTPEELTENKVVAYGHLIHPHDLTLVWEKVQESIRAHTVFQMIYRIHTKDDQWKRVWEQGRGVYDDHDNLMALEGFIADITEYARTEERLAAEKELLATTLSSIGDGVITTDIDSRITLINQVACNMIGIEETQAIGQPLEDVLHLLQQETRQRVENPVERVVRTGKTFEMSDHIILVTQNGLERMISDSAAPIRSADGQIIGIVLVFRDITEHVQIEEELLRAQKLESIGILAGGIAHDFNNILTSILGNVTLAKLLAEGNEGAELSLTEAEEAALRAKDLTQQLLTFSLGGMPIKKPAAIKPVVIDAVRHSTFEARTQCDIQIPENLWLIEFDKGQFIQVLKSLLTNADQAMPQGGSIVIRGENCPIMPEDHLPLPMGDYVRLSVSDQGAGIPEDHKNRIFDPYFTTKQKGSGLGLAIAHSIVKKHNGYILVDSVLDKGTTFHLYLPAIKQQLEIQSLGSVTESATKENKRILLMDDEELILKVTRELLSHFGYEVTCTKNGEEALEAYEQARQNDRPFAVVIMDLTIPFGMGGKETIIRLRALDPTVKAIVSSGYSTDPIMAEPHRYGFNAVATKPYKVEELLAVIKSVSN